MRKDRQCADTIRSFSEADRSPLPHRGVHTGLMAMENGTDTVTRSVEQPAVSLSERMENQKENLWMELLGASPVNTLCGQTHIQGWEWIPPLETIEKRLEKVLVLSNKSFSRSVAIRQVAMKVRNWALRHGKQRAAKLAAEHFGGAGE